MSALAATLIPPAAPEPVVDAVIRAALDAGQVLCVPWPFRPGTAFRAVFFPLDHIPRGWRQAHPGGLGDYWAGVAQ